MMLNKLKKLIRHKLNARKLSSLGESSQLLGRVDCRSGRATISVGSQCLILGNVVAETAESEIRIGNNVFVGGGSIFDCVVSIRIEDDVLISHECILADSDNHSVSSSIRKKDLADWKNGGGHDWSTTRSSPVVIGKGAWIGTRAIILKGVTVGEGSVVGAGSVVTKNVPPYTIVGGNPARVIREIPLDER